MPVRQVPAVRQIHGQNLVTRFEHREVDRHVRLRAAVRLHIHMFAAEQSFCAINGQLLGNIDILTAAVPALSRVALGILVCQHTALGLHHCTAREVFGCN